MKLFALYTVVLVPVAAATLWGSALLEPSRAIVEPTSYGVATSARWKLAAHAPRTNAAGQPPLSLASARDDSFSARPAQPAEVTRPEPGQGWRFRPLSADELMPGPEPNRTLRPLEEVLRSRDLQRFASGNLGDGWYESAAAGRPSGAPEVVRRDRAPY